MGCFSGRLMSAASDQKLFCKVYSPFCCSFNEFVEEKVITRPIPPPSWLLPRTLLLWWSSVQFLILWLDGEILDSESDVDFSEVNFPKVNSLKIISPTPYRLVLGMFVLPLSDLALALEKIWLCSRKSPRLCVCHTACGWPKGGVQCRAKTTLDGTYTSTRYFRG